MPEVVSKGPILTLFAIFSKTCWYSSTEVISVMFGIWYEWNTLALAEWERWDSGWDSAIAKTCFGLRLKRGPNVLFLKTNLGQASLFTQGIRNYDFDFFVGH